MLRLILAAERNLIMNELADQILYTHQNNLSQHKFLRLSARIYKEILKYSLSSLVSSAIDIGLFALFIQLVSTNSIPLVLLGATAFARLISSTINFSLNKKYVFGIKGSTSSQLAKYYFLCVVQTAFSWLILYSLSLLFFDHIVLLKIITDTFLFFISYTIQHLYIFRRNTINGKSS